MTSGWSLLAEDGVLVYSTCSLSVKQNEENVAWFLHEFKDEASLEPLPGLNEVEVKPAPTKPGWTHASMSDEEQKRMQIIIQRYCVRFDPLVSATSGFFVARFRKSRMRPERK
jgi:16S rRNA C967 or C1407 C5-methylase (RsmB/RsmF family)